MRHEVAFFSWFFAFALYAVRPTSDTALLALCLIVAGCVAA